MNEQDKNGDSGAGEMDDIGQLIKLAGARDAVPDERFERSRQKVRAHWQQVVAEPSIGNRPGRYRVVAMAAGIAVAVVTAYVFLGLPNRPLAKSIASVERVLGEVQVEGDIAAGTGAAIKADTLVVTGPDGRIALRMAGGQSLRIDTESRVIVHSPDHISLDAGALYIDTAAAPEGSPMLVSTPLGTAQDIGTQFQVRLAEMMLVVGVRQGMVEVSQPGKQSLSINTGYYVELSDAGESNEQPLEADDPDWKWIETITPEFDIQGASLEQYLLWYAHESGMELTWADEESAEKARKALLSGSIAGAGLEESLAIVRKVAPFELQINAKSILVKVQ